ncbi:unnamed protein product [Somion occarium]|uniref:Uncharacterized protein n=1 Tax=Somion occarium TaxID=3059160 RepID=A0ABP1CS97_9APHY
MIRRSWKLPLSVNVDCDINLHDDMAISGIVRVPSLFISPATSLEKLFLFNADLDVGEPDEPPPGDFSHHLPSLRELFIQRSPFSLIKSFLVPSLQKLELDTFWFTEPRVEELMDTLQNLPFLVDLNLRGCLAREGEPWLPNRNPVPLHHLRRLIVSSTTSRTCSWFLRHLDTPEIAQFGTLLDDGEDAVVDARVVSRLFSIVASKFCRSADSRSNLIRAVPELSRNWRDGRIWREVLLWRERSSKMLLLRVRCICHSDGRIAIQILWPKYCRPVSRIPAFRNVGSVTGESTPQC